MGRMPLRQAQRTYEQACRRQAKAEKRAARFLARTVAGLIGRDQTGLLTLAAVLSALARWINQQRAVGARAGPDRDA